GSSGQPLTGYQGMPDQKLMRAHASDAFALEREDPERLLAAGDDDAAPARLYDLAWRTGTPIAHFRLPDLLQERLWLGGQKRVCAGPRVQGANAVPQAARRLGPVQAPVVLVNLARVAGPGLWLFAGNDFSGDIFLNSFHQQPGPDPGEPALQRLGV